MSRVTPDTLALGSTLLDCAAMDCPDANELAAFVGRTMEAEPARVVASHLESCDSCQDLVAFATIAATSITAGSSPRGEIVPSVPGTEIDRYRILEQIGIGAMGIVYLAFDPKLERNIALKVVRDETPAQRVQLEREAQLAARLQHPNVVAIHDTGTVGDEVFVAMEYIAGVTLAEWIQQPHSVREVVAVFGQAARGLAAMHDAGLVHRDFKPSNVLVGGDGRVRVVDFGLARRIGEPARHEIVGSPAYMAPEQHRGLAADTRSDQFAFCVALYEALHGNRPFAGENLEQLASRMIEGRLERPTRRTSIPRWLRSVVRRGLRVRPEDRFASMTALASALERGRSRMWVRRIAIAVVALAVTGAGATIVRRNVRSAECHAEREQVAALFDDRAAGGVRAAFLATGLSYAPTTADRTVATLRRYATDLAGAAEAACRSSAVEPDTTSAARRACIAQRGAALTALVDSFEHADRATLVDAIGHAASLAVPTPCDDRELRAHSRSRASFVTDIARLGTAEGLLAAGRPRDATPIVEAALSAARTRGDRAGELAALLLLGRAYRQQNDAAHAGPALNDAVVLAERLGYDDDAEDAYVQLADVTGVDGHDYATGHRLIALARAKLERAGRSDDDEIELLQTEGWMLQDESRLPEAVAAMRRAADLAARTYGADHPKRAAALGNLTFTLSGFDAPGAIEAGTRAVEIFGRALGEDHPYFAAALLNLGVALHQTGRDREARERLLRADEVFARALGPDEPNRGRVLAALGAVERALGHWDDAGAYFRRTLAIVERSSGPESADAGDVRDEIAELLLAAGKPDGAAAEAERSLAILEHAVGTEHPRVVTSLITLAKAELARRRARPAMLAATRALGIIEATPGYAANLAAEPRFVLAQALWELGSDRPRAHALVEQAKAAPGDLGVPREQLDAWLAAHPAP